MTPASSLHLQNRMVPEHQQRYAQLHCPATVDQTLRTSKECEAGEERRDSTTTVSTKSSPLCGPAPIPLTIDDGSDKKNDFWDPRKEPVVTVASKLTLAGPVRETRASNLPPPQGPHQNTAGDIRQRRRVELNSILDGK